MNMHIQEIGMIFEGTKIYLLSVEFYILGMEYLLYLMYDYFGNKRNI